MAAKRILSQAQPTTVAIDQLVTQFETTLGKAHTPSPFQPIYDKYGDSKAETAKEEIKEAPKAKKEKRPKSKSP